MVRVERPHQSTDAKKTLARGIRLNKALALVMMRTSSLQNGQEQYETMIRQALLVPFNIRDLDPHLVKIEHCVNGEWKAYTRYVILNNDFVGYPLFEKTELRKQIRLNAEGFNKLETTVAATLLSRLLQRSRQILTIDHLDVVLKPIKLERLFLRFRFTYSIQGHQVSVVVCGDKEWRLTHRRKKTTVGSQSTIQDDKVQQLDTVQQLSANSVNMDRFKNVESITTASSANYSNGPDRGPTL